MEVGVKIAFVGDVVGKPGRLAVRSLLPKLITDSSEFDAIIINGENSSGFRGITHRIFKELIRAGATVVTTGNHVWAQQDVFNFIDDEPRIVRPANYPAGTPGSGLCTVTTAAGEPVAVVNIMGRIFMQPIDNPFSVVLDQIRLAHDHARVVLVDFHAETTSEKIAMGWYLDSKVTAVVGTHTHVQTADARLLPGGTACITDVGMTGPHNSVIGVEKSTVISRFINGLPNRFETASGDPRLHAVVITADSITGRAINITRLSLNLQEVESLTAQPVA